MKFPGQVAVVTGAGAGIGRAIALEFAKEGADVVVVFSRNQTNANESARMIEAIGRKAMISKTDVSNSEVVRRMFDNIAKTFGRMDILVNNAGVYLHGPILELSEERWDRVLDVNLKATFLCTQAFGQYLTREGKKGKVINIGSINGSRPMRGEGNYATAKGGLINLTRVMALELAEYGITVNLVSPGAIADAGTNAESAKDPEYMKRVSQEIPLKRMGKPKEVAQVVLFLASEAGDYITGSEIIIDGGLMLYPYTV
jgi:NAD(P)-dependent dehydrogenase (short-subunit alcohol dehydrogenase family)